MRRTRPHVVITGTSRGLGQCLAASFLRAGWKISAIGRFVRGKKVLPVSQIPGDVRFPEELSRAAAVACKKNGPISVWINNAGISAWKSLAKIDEEFWDLMIDTNLKSVLFGSQAAAHYMPKGGVILNVSSLAGKRGSAHNSAYCAAKFGVNGITQALAKELGPQGIRVNAVCPVYVDTPGLRTALEEPASPARGKDIQKYLNGFAREQSAMGRLPSAREVADLCLFLASPAASAITGQCINVDCGVLPQ